MRSIAAYSFLKKVSPHTSELHAWREPRCFGRVSCAAELLVSYIVAISSRAFSLLCVDIVVGPFFVTINRLSGSTGSHVGRLELCSTLVANIILYPNPICWGEYYLECIYWTGRHPGSRSCERVMDILGWNLLQFRLLIDDGTTAGEDGISPRAAEDGRPRSWCMYPPHSLVLRFIEPLSEYHHKKRPTLAVGDSTRKEAGVPLHLMVHSFTRLRTEGLFLLCIRGRTTLIQNIVIIGGLGASCCK